jgi:hypothetical protein
MGLAPAVSQQMSVFTGLHAHAHMGVVCAPKKREMREFQDAGLHGISLALSVPQDAVARHPRTK